MNEAPDFKSLAPEIISKRCKSRVGVEDEKKLLLIKIQKEQIKKSKLRIKNEQLIYQDQKRELYTSTTV